MELTADVKCYFCGHIIGQVIGRRGQPIRADSFIPRPGYAGPQFSPGERLRCERCLGPVFLEDVTPFIPSRLTNPTRADRDARRPPKAA